ncbi:hypothetical protein D3C78_1901130 [compost metagenome]
MFLREFTDTVEGICLLGEQRTQNLPVQNAFASASIGCQHQMPTRTLFRVLEHMG